jgi:oligoribonuclease NrnB/cAMP/cGMP phosphodiesterase (DHH superfamily)
MKETTKIGIYHKNCTDGTTAAAVLLRKFPDIKLFPLVQSHTEDDLAHIHKSAGEGSEIYFVDFSAGVEEFLDGGHNIIVIDHHMSVKEHLEELEKNNENLTYIFNNDKSGASLAWTYFFQDEKEPELIKYVQDSDIWTKKYDDTKYVTNYLSMFSNDPEQMLKFIEGDIDEIKEKGKIISNYSDIQIGRLVESVQEIKLRIGEYEVPGYNVTMYKSPVGNKLSVIQDKAVAMFTISGGDVNLSFRGTDSNSPTALELAQLLEGGGHKNAAGANISLEDFIKMIIL